MSPAAPNTTRKLSLRRPTSRQGKRAIGISMLAFFAAIAVVGWFGLSGIDVEDEEPTRTRQLIFAGGSPRLAVVEETRSGGDATGANEEEEEEEEEEEDYVIGSFGEPVDEFYADEDLDSGGGGWGDAAINRMSDFGSGSSASVSKRGRN